MDVNEINIINEQNSSRTKRISEYYALIDSLGYEVSNYGVIDKITNKIANGSNKPFDVLNALQKLESGLQKNNLEEPLSVLRESFQNGLSKVEELFSKSTSNSEAASKLLTKMKNNFGLTNSDFNRVQRTKASRDKTQAEIDAINEVELLTAKEIKKLIALKDDENLTEHQKIVQKYAKLPRAARWEEFKRLQYTKQGANLASIKSATSISESAKNKMHDIRSINELEVTLQEFQKLVLASDFSREDAKTGIREALISYMRDLSEAIASYRTVLVEHDKTEKKYLTATEALGLKPKEDIIKGKKSTKTSTAKMTQSNTPSLSDTPKISFDQFLKNKSQYTPESWETFERSYIDAMTITNEEERISAIEAASSLLDSTIEPKTVPSETVQEVNMQPLETAMNAIKEFIKNQDKFTPESFETFKQAFIATQSMPETTEEELSDKLIAIRNAASNLKPINVVHSIPTKPADTLTETAKLVAAEFIKNKEKYTPESYQAFEQAYMRGLSSATTETEAVEAIRDASLLLNPISIMFNQSKPITKTPNPIIKSSNPLMSTVIKASQEFIENKNKYTPESYATFEQSYSEAITMPETTEEEIADKITAIRNAANKLRPTNIVFNTPGKRANSLVETAKLAAQEFIKNRKMYTPESYAAFEQAYIDGLSFATTELEEVEAIKDACALLQPINKEMASPKSNQHSESFIQESTLEPSKALATAITIAQNFTKDKNRFTPESYNAFEQALTSALAISNENEEAKLVAIRDASNLLKLAELEVKQTPKKQSNLVNQIKNQIDQFTKDKSKFTPESYAIFEQAYQEALAMSDEDEQAKIAAISSAGNLLRFNVIPKTEPITEKPEIDEEKEMKASAEKTLKISLSTANSYINGASAFTPESYAAFDQAYQKALAMSEDTVQQILNKSQAINNAMLLLKKKTYYNTNTILLDSVIKNVENLNEKDYTPESFETFKKAYEEALKKPKETIYEVNDIITEINNAKKLLVRLNLSSLTYAKKTAEALKKDKIHASAWQEFESRYQKALSMPQNTQQEIDEKAKAIEAAIQYTKLDFTKLDECIANVNNLDQNLYSIESWTTFLDSYTGILNQPTSSQLEINDIVSQINAAITQLVPIKYDELNNAINEITSMINELQEINNKKRLYTDENWQEFINAYEEALKMPAETQAEIDAKTAAMLKTKEVLKELNYTLLDDARKMTELPADINYSVDSWKQYDAAINEAEQMPETNQEEIEAKAAAITSAIGMLVRVDYTQLDKSNEAIANMDDQDFTTKSWNKFVDELNVIERLPENNQKDINYKNKKMQEAMLLLKKKKRLVRHFEKLFNLGEEPKTK